MVGKRARAFPRTVGAVLGGAISNRAQPWAWNAQGKSSAVGRGVPAEPCDRTAFSEVRSLESEVLAAGQPFQRKERRGFDAKEREEQPGRAWEGR